MALEITGRDGDGQGDNEDDINSVLSDVVSFVANNEDGGDGGTDQIGNREENNTPDDNLTEETTDTDSFGDNYDSNDVATPETLPPEENEEGPAPDENKELSPQTNLEELPATENPVEMPGCSYNALIVKKEVDSDATTENEEDDDEFSKLPFKAVEMPSTSLALKKKKKKKKIPPKRSSPSRKKVASPKKVVKKEEASATPSTSRRSSGRLSTKPDRYESTTDIEMVKKIDKMVQNAPTPKIEVATEEKKVLSPEKVVEASKKMEKSVKALVSPCPGGSNPKRIASRRMSVSQDDTKGSRVIKKEIAEDKSALVTTEGNKEADKPKSSSPPAKASAEFVKRSSGRQVLPPKRFLYASQFTQVVIPKGQKRAASQISAGNKVEATSKAKQVRFSDRLQISNRQEEEEFIPHVKMEIKVEPQPSTSKQVSLPPPTPPIQLLCSFCPIKIVGMDKFLEHLFTHEEVLQKAKAIGSHSNSGGNMPQAASTGNFEKIRHKGRFKYACNVCGKLVDRYHLEGHMRTHTGEKPEECPLCFNKFYSLRGVQIHIKRVHKKLIGVATLRKMKMKENKSKKASVGSPRKSKRATGSKVLSPNRMPIPSRSRGKVKSYKCSQCPKTYTQWGNLRVHFRTHTGEKPFKCPYCDKRDHDPANMKKHIATKHKSLLEK